MSIYAMQEAAYAAAQPMRAAARAAREFWSSPANPWAQTEFGHQARATAQLFGDATRRHGKPAWRIDGVDIDGTAVGVREEVAWASPWVRMLHFARDPADMARAGRTGDEPRVLIVAPLSGHYATLLRGTVQAFLKDHEVYVTDWVNAREVPVADGRFDFHDYIEHVRAMLRELGPRPHVVAVCQPGPAVMAAAALMSKEGAASRPASMTFMGSPIDARLSPTAPTELAAAKPFAWFRSNMIQTVPAPYAGAMRRVYPGFVQLYAFMSMNADRHRDAQRRYFADLVKGDGDGAAKHLEFYDEYLSVLDLTEEFFLQTIDYVFQRHLLPQGLLQHRGELVDLGAITDIGLMTVEGEHDDISGVGQTQAAHGLTPNLPDALKALYVQPDVGHYGVFNGQRFRDDIYPRVRDFIAARRA